MTHRHLYQNGKRVDVDDDSGIPEQGSLVEKRRNLRASINMLVTYWVDLQGRTEGYAAESLDLSEDGIFIQLDTPLALGTEVLLQFRLPGTERDIRVEGLVIWARNRQMANKELPGKGIEFKNIDGKTKQLLHEYIKGWK